MKRRDKITGRYIPTGCNGQGITLKKYYCKCGRKISFHTALYGSKQCKFCAMKIASEKKYPLKYTNTAGYVYIRVRNHPYTTKSGYILEHRFVMEKHLGRYLKQNELIHHINGIRNDNRIENLAITNANKHERYTLQKILQKRIIKLEKLLHDKK